MNLLDREIAPLGMGCWPIAGPFYWGEKSMGYANAEDTESIRTIHAALAGGVTLFDTAAVYGAGHSERLLGQALVGHPDAMIVTKIGIGFDEATKHVTGEETAPKDVGPAIDRCLARLRRDRIDILLLHLNELSPETAQPIFDAMEAAMQAGKIRAFGWSTDFPESIAAIAGRPGCVAVEHAMNVFVDVPSIQRTVAAHDLVALIRSPLAMGVLTGKFDADTVLDPRDNRARNEPWHDYFTDGKVSPDFLRRLDAIRALLQTGGRSLVQGALGWLWAKAPHNLPIPGARTVAQIEDSAGALSFGPLPADVMAEIEVVLARPPEGPVRAR